MLALLLLLLLLLLCFLSLLSGVLLSPVHDGLSFCKAAFANRASLKPNIHTLLPQLFRPKKEVRWPECTTVDADVVQLQTALLDVVVAIFDPRLTGDDLLLHKKFAPGIAVVKEKVAIAKSIGHGLQLLL